MSTSNGEARPISSEVARGYLRIATEEAYAPPEIIEAYRTLLRKESNLDPGFVGQWDYFLGDNSRAFALLPRLQDLGERRLREMDESGIDKQVLALTSPGVQVFDVDTGTALSKLANEQIADAVTRHPGRFAGIAAVAPQDPPAAARELERAVTKLGLKGVVINSHIHGEYLDNRKFWDIFAAAEALDVPVYLHPSYPSPQILQPFADYGLEGAIFGFSVETSLHTLRIIFSGVFDRFPKLKMILGHCGESLPYWFYRMDYFQRSNAVANRYPHLKKLDRQVSEYFRENFWITTSGMAWAPPVLYCQQVMGVDRVLYAMDYPYQYVPAEVKTYDELPMNAELKKKFFQQNAEKLFKL